MEHHTKVRQRSTGNDVTRGRSGSDASAADGEEKEVVSLQRNLGLFDGVAMVVGTIIGSGIFISPKGIVREVGSAGMALVVWVLCGLLTMIASLSYAELGTLIQESGGEYPYFKYGFGRRAGFLLAYLYSWSCLTVLKSSTVAILALVCAEYLTSLFFTDTCGKPPAIIVKCTAVVVIVCIGLINSYSVQLASRIQVIFTVAKLGALGIICVGGVVNLARGNSGALSNSFEGTVTNPGRIAIAFYNGMWAYDGWNQLNIITEEIINPEKNFPRAILIGIPLVTVVYVIVNISYFSVMSVGTLLASPGVATTWAESIIPSVVWIIPLSVAFSTFGACNGTLFAAGRLNFAAARDGNIMKMISYLHVRQRTPIPALIILCVMSICFVIPSEVDSLIDLFSFTTWLFYALTFLALILLRYTRPYKDLHRPFKVPLLLPILALLVSTFLVVAPIVDAPRVEFLYSTAFVLGGLLLYVPFVVFKLVLPGTDGLTKFVQLLLQVAPPPEFDVMEAHRDVTDDVLDDAVNSGSSVPPTASRPDSSQFDRQIHYLTQL